MHLASRFQHPLHRLHFLHCSFFWQCIGITFLYCFPLVFFLANAPQNPDGAEILMVAQWGGVPHPPGFPLLCWINKLALFVFSNHECSTVLAAVSLLFHALSTYLFMCSVAILGTKSLAFLAGALYCYCPLVLGMAIQPEKYSFLLFILNLNFYSAFRLFAKKERLFLLLYGASVGLGLAHHDAGILLFLFSPLVMLFLWIKHSMQSTDLFLGLLLIFLIPLLAFASLPYLRGNSPWVDWGNLQGLRDSYLFPFNKEFGQSKDLHQGFSISTLLQRVNADVLELLYLNLKDLFTGLGVLFTVVAGILSFLKLSRKRIEGFYLLINLLGMMFIVSLVKFDIDLPALGYMERYAVLPLLPSLFFITFGLKEMGNLVMMWSRIWPKGRHLRYGSLSVLIFIYLAWYILQSYRINGFMNNGLLKAYLQSLGRNIPAEAFYISDQDWTTFHGVPYGKSLRFPIVNFFPLSWYRHYVAPRLDVRIENFYEELNEREFWTFYDLIQVAFDKGHVIASTGLDLIKNLAPHVERRGLIWIASVQVKNVKQGHWPENVGPQVNKICESIMTITKAVPLKGNYFNKKILQDFGIYFGELSRHFFHEGQLNAANYSRNLAMSMRPGASPKLWGEYCRKILIAIK